MIVLLTRPNECNYKFYKPTLVIYVLFDRFSP